MTNTSEAVKRVDDFPKFDPIQNLREVLAQRDFPEGVVKAAEEAIERMKSQPIRTVSRNVDGVKTGLVVGDTTNKNTCVKCVGDACGCVSSEALKGGA